MKAAPPPDAAAAEMPALDVVQSWFQAVVTHPGGVAAGAASTAARQLVRLDRGQLEGMVRRSSRLSADERLSIYANAYYARLLECLGDCLPVLKRVVGAEVFDAFAFDYLQRYPSRSYTLDRLAENFPRFLEETRPDRQPQPGEPGANGGDLAGTADEAAGAPATDGADVTGGPEGTGGGEITGDAGGLAEPGWPDFLIDLATFEWAIAKVFDGPGVEGEPLLTAEQLATFGAAVAPAAGNAGGAAGIRPPDTRAFAAEDSGRRDMRETGGQPSEIEAGEQSDARCEAGAGRDGPEDPGDAGPSSAISAGEADGAGAPSAMSRFAASRLVTVPCLRLLALRFPVNELYGAALADAAGSELAIPAPGRRWVALSRTDWVVRRYSLSEFEHGLLAALAAGQPVGEAIAAAAAASALPDAALAAELGAAFRRFTAAGFFRTLA